MGKTKSHKVGGAAVDEYEFDWVKKGAVTEVKTQFGDVCWAFVTIAVIESILQIATGGKLITLSEQYLIDCDTLNRGFRSGNPRKALEYIVTHGGSVYRDEDYPFIGKKGICQCGQYEPAGTIHGYKKVQPAGDEKTLRKAVAKHPVVAQIDSRYIRNYKGDILMFNAEFSLESVEMPEIPGHDPREGYLHGLVIVGYGKKLGVEYWKCKHSGGSSWGKHGYLLIQRNVPDHEDAFGLARKCFYPLIQGFNSHKTLDEFLKTTPRDSDNKLKSSKR